MNHSKRDIERQVENLGHYEDDGERELRQTVPVELVKGWYEETNADAVAYEWLEEIAN